MNHRQGSRTESGPARGAGCSTVFPEPPDAGFTLVEILAILAILAVLTGLALPRIGAGRARVDGATFELSARLMEAQRRAVLRQHDLRVLFDVDGGGIFVHEDLDNDGTRDGGESWSRTDLPEGAVFGMAGAPRVGIDAAGPVTFEIDAAENRPALTFHRNGSASEQGVVYLASAGENRVTEVRAIEVHRSTGRAICWSYRTGSWTEGC